MRCRARQNLFEVSRNSFRRLKRWKIGNNSNGVKQMVSLQTNKILISVLQCDGYDFSGYFLFPTKEQYIPFHSFAELVLKLERRLEEIQPLPNQKLRDFPGVADDISDNADKPLAVSDADTAKKLQNCKARFFLQICFRQHLSWQGKIEYPGENRTESFRSVLELLCLMRKACCESDRLTVEKV